MERAFGGITSGKPEDKLGIRGSNSELSAHLHTAVVVISLHNIALKSHVNVLSAYNPLVLYINNNKQQ